MKILGEHVGTGQALLVGLVILISFIITSSLIEFITAILGIGTIGLNSFGITSLSVMALVGLLSLVLLIYVIGAVAIIAVRKT